MAKRLDGIGNVKPDGEEVFQVADTVDLVVLVVEVVEVPEGLAPPRYVRRPVGDGAEVRVVVDPHPQRAGEGGDEVYDHGGKEGPATSHGGGLRTVCVWPAIVDQTGRSAPEGAGREAVRRIRMASGIRGTS